MSVVDRLGVNKLLQLLPHRAWPSSCLVVSGVHTAEQALTKLGPRGTWLAVIGRQILDARPPPSVERWSNSFSTISF